MTNPIAYLALDPGESTGWATFRQNGDAVEYGTLKGRDALYTYLDKVDLTIHCVIVEDYKLFPWKSGEQSWSTMDTVRYIGAVEYWADKTARRLVFQAPNIKSMGYRWAGITKPKRKNLTHETDAYVHGVYYLQKAGIRKPQHGRKT